MLYRAFVFSVLIHSQEDKEFTAFFEAAPQADAGQVLQRLVGAVWGVPPGGIEHYNLASEAELRTHWAWAPGKDAQRDAALLQVGNGPDGGVYANPHRTLLLCQPEWHVRLAQAQEHVAREQRMQLGRALIDKAVARTMATRATTQAQARMAAPRNLHSLLPGVTA